MNKSEFTKVYADRLGVTIKEAENNLATFISTLTECLKNGEYVHVSGFATFELKDKQARDGVNPLNGEKVLIPACKSPNAKFSKTFKAIFND
ncbi:MAG: HU family DNA-binding protein [Clostridia bacterium]|nr:HU family DNA-binding protein [Clostridia bacterium]